VGKILAGELGVAGGDDRKTLVNHYLTAMEGPFACERMVQVLQKMVEDWSTLPGPPLKYRMQGWYKAIRRRLMKRLKSRLPWHSHNSPEFQRHRYPEISREQMRERVLRFQQVLGDTEELKVEHMFDQFFRISP
jgi:hypothetical protein